MLQALLYFPCKKRTKLALLKIKTKPNNIKVRNVDIMLSDFKKWKESIKDIEDFKDVEYNINEYLLMDIVPSNKIEVVNIFSVPSEIAEFKIDPNSLKKFVFGTSSDLIKNEKIKTFNLILKFIFLKIKEKFKI